MYSKEPIHDDSYECDMCEQPGQEDRELYSTENDIVLCADCMATLETMPSHIQERLQASILKNIV